MSFDCEKRSRRNFIWFFSEELEHIARCGKFSPGALRSFSRNCRNYGLVTVKGCVKLTPEGRRLLKEVAGCE